MGVSSYEQRQKARTRINHETLYCITGRPPCTDWCTLNVNWNCPKMDPAEARRRQIQALVHIELCCQLYRDQIARNCISIHGHPKSAYSLQCSAIQSVFSLPNVHTVTMDMCQFGMTSHIDVRHGPRGPVAKPTGFMTSSWTLYNELSKPCRDPSHVHVPLVNTSVPEARGGAEAGLSKCDLFCSSSFASNVVTLAPDEHHD